MHMLILSSVSMMNSVALYFTIFQLTLSSLLFPSAAIKNKKTKIHHGGRVVGGSDVEVSYPFIVKIETLNPYYGWVHHCTGSVLTERAVLTACHCVIISGTNSSGVPPLKNPRSMRVRAGIVDAMDFQNGQMLGVERLEPHPLCHEGTEYTIMNDVGVLILAGELQFTQTVQPLMISSRNVAEALAVLRTLEERNALCYVQGWGSISPIRTNLQLPQRLQLSRPRLLTSQRCSDYSCTQPALAKDWCGRNFYRWHQICARDEASTNCGGDSGAPLICDGVLFGVYSNGADDYCYPGQPTIYADIQSISYFVNKYW